ncbi:NAD(P)/FAD-dependent oxidoreductase [Nocardia sp. alder85J]|uniref:NAD(P)/FAD-dependent oxidoreductase n=1 Tax=Nocardia sp. alder85J TaxID=2862949 RepID=UPI001CD6CD8F|nr:NAD(P)/FAD-dependent oxidoreductase [Nocardia sp. alder85J]MCX4098272.1 NAD(P)/FAD-dependent oxidoreductase [Nocardia sp. alder85J]
MADTSYDTIVIGGGPAGCAYALTMLRRGYSVLLLEKVPFPRFHIGESFLPYTTEILDQLGLLDAVMAKPYAYKPGVELTGMAGSVRRIDFGMIGDNRRTWAIQVERAEFDKTLLDETAAAGVTVLEEATVTDVDVVDGRVTGVTYTVNGETHHATATFIADASGRAGVIPKRLNLRVADSRLKMAAVFKHYGDLDESQNPGVEGDTQLGIHPDGWMWGIPLRSDAISIGAVAPMAILQSDRPEAVFDEHLARLPRIQERLRGAKVIRELKGERNFEYHSETLAGPGYFLVGDAGSFTDPVFSGGVLLALATGRKAAELAADRLEGNKTETEIADLYNAFFKTGYETYYRLICAVYDHRQPIMGQVILDLAADLDPKWHVRLVSGDFWTGESPLVNRLRAEKDWSLFAPFDLLTDCPIYPSAVVA